MDKLMVDLCNQVSIPGNEDDVKNIIYSHLKRYGSMKESVWGDIICEKKGIKGNPPKIAICAHMDSPGFIVKRINIDGTLNLIPLGGISPKSGNMQKVKLKSKNGYFDGVITVNDSKDGGDYTGFFGFVSVEEAKAKGVNKGDVAGWSELPFGMGKFLCAPNMDNRIGCYLLVKLAEIFGKMDCDHTMYFVATTCEETSLGRGARVVSSMIDPDLAIVFDVTYEEDDVRMGGGPTLTLSDNSVYMPMRIRDKLLELADKNDIPFQLEVYNYAGTDSKYFVTSGNMGTITLPLLIPTLNNHSSLEIINSKDLESTLEFTKLIVENIGEIL